MFCIRGQVHLVTIVCRARVLCGGRLTFHVYFVVAVLNGRVPEGARVAAILIRDPMGALVIPVAGRSGIEVALLQIEIWHRYYDFADLKIYQATSDAILTFDSWLGEQQRTDWDRRIGPWMHSQNTQIRTQALSVGSVQVLSKTQVLIQAPGRHWTLALCRALTLAQGIPLTPVTQPLHKALSQALHKDLIQVLHKALIWNMPRIQVLAVNRSQSSEDLCP